MQKSNSIYLFLGDDWLSKQRKISWIKKENLKKGISDFNIDTFYADELSGYALKDALYTLAAVDKKRVLIIKKIEKLSPKNKKLILSFVSKPNPSCILILDSEAPSIEKNPFLHKISETATTLNLRKIKRTENVFDLCRAISQRNSSMALRVLSGLLSSGEKPLKILGGISWYWTKKNISLDKSVLRRNIDLLLETDVNIKTGKIDPNFALEFLVVRLVS